ncbi:Dbp10p [Sugiyamaella lignohabitans]|uniref:ATP-dependent RNA helicase DBP10 n=1 Tax=Sugiyamaella lignohabitans TaxID=796027 RepID=A0A167CX74_9ASCO|nr:Dbp10p [Sugiyamaella lignohabitans]ANB12215.1 Dbp10p [Sugiyamaella lignohabitans]
MSDSEDDFDITKSLALNGDESDYESASDTDSDLDQAGDLQDEILSSSDEEDMEEVVDTKKVGRQVATGANASFPSLELDSDDDDEEDGNGNKNQSSTKRKKDDDLMEYFAAPKVKKASTGTFAGLGLSKGLLNNIARKGFKTPTPIQRKTIPLVLDGRDVVGMARTGSGKTAAFCLPMIEKLKVHSAKVGARAVIMSPSRELALQTLKVIKEFSKGTDLRCVLLVGGDSLEEQFGYMMSNPDIIIATPGRFMHLKVEMQLDLKSVEYIVFDEADRLFELGFSEQLNEIIASLSSSRQTLLFSATLPKSLVEFAKAGLHDPVLVRLDAEAKVSDDLEMAFFSTKDGEREAVLLSVLETIIKMPSATEEQKKYLENQNNRALTDDEDDENNKKDDKKSKYKKKFKHSVKRDRLPPAHELPTAESTIVFVPTKHHVEYISTLLQSLGYAVSFIYGTLDQSARKEQLYRFRAGKTSILVVTDVAARGIDIPVLANVINYSLPSSPKVFVHRVGRTARAGRRGWAYSIIKEAEVPYLLDLEVFLGRKLLLSRDGHAHKKVNYSERLVLGSMSRDAVELQQEEVEAQLSRDYDLAQLKSVASRGEQLYLKSREPASQESVKRGKEIVSSGWDFRHLLLGPSLETERQKFLDKLANRKVKETVFEFKKTKFAEAAELMARRRQQIAPIQMRAAEKKRMQENERAAGLNKGIDVELGLDEDSDDEDNDNDNEDNDDSHKTNGATNGKSKTTADLSTASEHDIQNTFEDSSKKRKRETFRDPNFYMSHYASIEAVQERGYSVGNGKTSANFADAARGATFDISGEGVEFQQKHGMRWDKKRGKFVNAGSEGGKNGQSTKFIRSESGQKIPASFRSGRFDSWKSAHKVGGLRVGALEANLSNPNSGPRGGSGDKKFRHSQVQAPKAADKARDDYHVRKKRVKEAVEKGLHVKGVRGKPISNGLNSVDQVRKQRELQQKRREKNARPSKKSKRH